MAGLFAGDALASTAGTPRRSETVGEAKEGEEGEGHEETPWSSDVQLRYGLAHLEMPNAEGVSLANRIDTITVMLSVGYEFGERLGVTVFLPVVFGRLTAEEEPTRGGPPSIGNLGVEVGLGFHPTANLLLEPRALVALPSARGVASGGSQTDTDRFYMLRAAGFSQGSQESALFESGRLGTELALVALWTPGRFLLRAWLKFEALFDVEGAVDPAIVESVGGVVLEYQLGLGFQAGLGFSYNRPLTAHEGSAFEAGTLDPVVEWRHEQVRLGLRAVLPIFGESLVEHTFGVSLFFNARF